MAQVAHPSVHIYPYQHHCTIIPHQTGQSTHPNDEIPEDPEKGTKVLQFLTEKVLPALQSDTSRKCLGKVKIYGIDFEIDLEENAQFHLKLREGRKVLLEWSGQSFAEISDDIAKTALFHARLKRKNQETDLYSSPYVINKENHRTTKQTSPAPHPSSAKKRGAFTPVVGEKTQSTLRARSPVRTYGALPKPEDPRIKGIREKLQALTKEYFDLGSYQMDSHGRYIDRLDKGQRQPINIERDIAVLTKKLSTPQYSNLPGAIQLRNDENLYGMVVAMGKRLDALGEDIEGQMRQALPIGDSPRVLYYVYAELEERVQLYRTISTVPPYSIDLTKLEDILKRALPHREVPPLTAALEKTGSFFKRLLGIGHSKPTFKPGELTEEARKRHREQLYYEARSLEIRAQARYAQQMSLQILRQSQR